MCLKDVAIEGSEIVAEMLTSTNCPFHLSIFFQIIPLKTQLPPASLVTITLSIILTQKKEKKKKEKKKKRTLIPTCNTESSESESFTYSSRLKEKKK